MGEIIEKMTMRNENNPSCCLAVDSDGCVFDSMRIKHESCFTPRLIEIWNLQDLRETVTKQALHLNLYSKHRGENRFRVLLKLFERLRDEPLFRNSTVADLDLAPLRSWIHSGAELSTGSLEKAIAQDPAPVLRDALRWSLAVNRDVAALPPARPFPQAVEALREAHDLCQIRVVSSANREALRREWTEAGLIDFVHELNGQEQGSKEAVLRRATREFDRGRILMAGDAPADQRAAESAGVLFFSIRAGWEEQDWNYFRKKLFPAFIKGHEIRETPRARRGRGLVAIK